MHTRLGTMRPTPWSKLLRTCALLVALLPLSSLSSHRQELVFLTWSEYIDPEVVAEFEAQFTAKVSFVYFESDDVRTEMLVETDGEGFDVMLVSGLAITPYARQDWLAPISESDVPNRKHINPRWANAFSGSSEYAVPYFWGTTGIGYRDDLIPEGISSWRELLNPPDTLRGKIVMTNYSRDLTGAALKALGYSVNTNDRRGLAAAQQLLEGQRPYVKSYRYLSLTPESTLVTGEVWASMMYSGDALLLQQYNEHIAYVLPEEGGNIWVDYLAIGEASYKKELAAQFINFLNEPEIAARVAEFVHYATPNQAAEQYLPQEYFQDPVIYPSQEELARSEFYQPLSPGAQKYTNEIVAKLMN